MIAMICVLSSGTIQAGYLLLPYSGHLRVFIFTVVCGVLSSLLRILLSVTSLIRMLPINWDLYVSTCICDLPEKVYLKSFECRML